MLNKTKEIISHLQKKAQHILLIGHIEPDGDTIGSLLAMGLSLNKIGKNTTLYIDYSIPDVYKRLFPSAHLIKNKIEDFTIFDTIIMLDCSNMERAGKKHLIITKIKTLINIDHHITNSNYGDISIVEPDACATAEIVFRLISMMNIGHDYELDYEAALGIYVGIFTDTGSFRFSSTNKAAFEICSKLISYGIKPYKIAKELYETYSFSRIKFKSLALNAIELSENGKVGMLYLTKKMFEDTSASSEDAGGLISYVIGIERVDIAAIIYEKGKDKFDVSLRSNGAVDVSKIAASYGGGGHVYAAGFSIASDISYLKKTIFKLSEKYN
jgi:bifunctional oligoribonuclease and PAP phosphatase NrnA